MFYKRLISGSGFLTISLSLFFSFFFTNANAQVRIFGEAFGDYAYKLHADPFGRGDQQYSGLKQDYNAFDIRRAAIGANAVLSPKFAAEFLLSHDGNTLSDGSRALYVKSANIRWKQILPGLDMIVGQQRAPSLTTMNGEEQFWKYRSIEKTLPDMRKIAPTFDLGLGFEGYNKDTSRGFNLMAGNNSGIKMKSNTSKRFYFDVYQKFFNKRLMVMLYTDYYQQYTNIPNEDALSAWNSYKVFVTWQTKKMTIGGEYVVQLGTNVPDIGSFHRSENIRPVGVSLFVHGSLLKDEEQNDKLNGFLRVDSWDPNQLISLNDPDAKANDIFLVAGLDYTPIKNIHFMPNIWLDAFSVKNASISPQKNDMDVVARITCSYKY